MLLVVHLNVKVICKPFVVTLVAVLYNAIYNITDIRPFLRPILNYYLWSSCGVENVITTCSGELSYTLPATPHSTCSYRELQSRLSEVLCAPSLTIGDIKNLFAGYMGCESFLQFVLDHIAWMQMVIFAVPQMNRMKTLMSTSSRYRQTVVTFLNLAPLNVKFPPLL